MASFATTANTDTTTAEAVSNLNIEANVGDDEVVENGDKASVLNNNSINSNSNASSSFETTVETDNNNTNRNSDVTVQSSDLDDEDEFFDAPSSLSEQTGVDVEWEVRYDPVHQHPYWINIITGESSWENPNGEHNNNDYTGEVEGYEYTEVVPQEQVAYDVTSSSNDMYDNNTGTNDDSNNNFDVINDNNNSVADDTWERHYDPESDWYYYYNPVTGETKWDNITEEYMGDGDYQSTIDENYYENNYTTDNLENNHGENSFNEQGEVVEEATSSSSNITTNSNNNSTVQAGVARAWLKEARKLQAIGAK
jgi:hypothetical protein